MKLLILHLSSTDYQRVDQFSGLWHTRHAFSVAAETWVRNVTQSKSSGFQSIIIKGFPVFSKFITTEPLQMNVTRSFELSGTAYPAKCHIPEDKNPQTV